MNEYMLIRLVKAYAIPRLCITFVRDSLAQMEHDRQMALKAEAGEVAARKKLTEVQRNALHKQMQERDTLRREVSVSL